MVEGDETLAKKVRKRRLSQSPRPASAHDHHLYAWHLHHAVAPVLIYGCSAMSCHLYVAIGGRTICRLSAKACFPSLKAMMPMKTRTSLPCLKEIPMPFFCHIKPRQPRNIILCYERMCGDCACLGPLSPFPPLHKHTIIAWSIHTHPPLWCLDPTRLSIPNTPWPVANDLVPRTETQALRRRTRINQAPISSANHLPPPFPPFRAPTTTTQYARSFSSSNTSLVSLL